jgi:hypothetical protein
MTEVPSTSPGSYDQFVDRSGLDPQSPKTLTAFTKAAGEHRIAIAEGLGITLEELHVSPNPGTGTDPESPTGLAA